MLAPSSDDSSSSESLAVDVAGVHKSFRPNTTWSDILRGRFTRPPIAALSGIDLRVKRGELVGLAGPNGAGKSTLLRSVAGLLLPDQGSVHVCGRTSARDDLAYRRSVGYAVGEERSHFWRLSGRDNLRFFAALHGLTGSAQAERIDEVLGIVQLHDEADRPVREFSTGMRQRLSLARGLLGRPDVILLDEPTRGLDPGNAARVRRFVLDDIIGRRGLTVLYATHNVSEMKELCPRVALISKGRIVADGPFDEV
ncbi:MAG: ABC-2 type transport system ATP-binding protein, partial [Myxococcota bacterium]